MSITIDEQIKWVEWWAGAAMDYGRELSLNITGIRENADSVIATLRRVDALEKENAELRAKISEMEEKAESEAIERAYRLPED